MNDDLRVRLPAQPLAAAWLNVALASGDDDERPSLYRTVSIEVFGAESVRLVSTDSYLLLTSYVSDRLGPEPHLDEAPDQSLLVSDADGRAKSLMQFLLAACKKDGDIQWRYVDLSITSLEKDDTPTLDPDLDRLALIIDAEIERLTLPILDMPFPTWRGMWPTSSLRDSTATGEPVNALSFSADRLAIFGKLKNAGPGVRMRPNGRLGPVLIETDAEPPVDGVLVPIRDERDEQ